MSQREPAQLFDLTGRVAVITGGAGHLGSALCRALAQAGATVYLAARDQARCADLAQRLSAETPGQGRAAALDMRTMAAATACLEAVAADAGRLDILVNNAAFYAGLTLENTGEDEWLTGLDGALHGAYRCLKAALPCLTGGGSIINIGSMYGLVSPDPKAYEGTPYGNPPNYGAGKAALIQLTRYAACHLAPRGVRVNAISPGPFPNPTVQENGLFMERLGERNPMGRIGRPWELMGAVVYLASDASAYVTGANLVVDGGWTAW